VSSTTTAPWTSRPERSSSRQRRRRQHRPGRSTRPGRSCASTERPTTSSRELHHGLERRLRRGTVTIAAPTTSRHRRRGRTVNFNAAASTQTLDARVGHSVRQRRFHRQRPHDLVGGPRWPAREPPAPTAASCSTPPRRRASSAPSTAPGRRPGRPGTSASS
jgi:hypothetical protein